MESFLETLRIRNLSLYYFGLVCLFSAAICVALIFFTNTKVLGINAWIKPFKFFLSSAIFSWTMGWLLHYLGNDKQFNVYAWVIIIVLAFETIYIAYQAGRTELSHFNVKDSFHGLMFALMGIAITIMTLWTGYICILFFIKSFPNLPPAYLWGIRLGLLFFVIFAFEGGIMAAKLSHTIGAADGSPGMPLTNWSKTNGDLRIAHFLGMHALQILPLVTFYFVRNVKAAIFISCLYFVITAALFIQAMLGKPLLKF